MTDVAHQKPAENSIKQNERLVQDKKLDHQFKEDIMWMSFDNQTFKVSDKVVKISDKIISTGGSSYREVHNTFEGKDEGSFFSFTDKPFFDKQWDVRQSDPKSLDDKSPVVFKRLGHLYPTNQDLRPAFFPKNGVNQPLRKVTDNSKIPHAIYEMGMLQMNQFKSLFFTQDFQATGKYYAVVNHNGRWETDVVDDYIPVYQSNGHPIWGMDLEQPWQLILLKFWAKRLRVKAQENGENPNIYGGYSGVKNSHSFEFINTFSNANWKFYNLSVDPQTFFKRNQNKFHNGHIILKTKNSKLVAQAGLIPGEAIYQLESLVEYGGEHVNQSGVKQSGSHVSHQKTKYIAQIKSCYKTHWVGSHSVVDPQFLKAQSQLKEKSKQTSSIKSKVAVNSKKPIEFGIDRSFVVAGDDILNLFSCAYVTSRRLGQTSFSNYHIFTVPKNRRDAMFFEFNLPQAGFLDFSVKQMPMNKIQAGQKSRLQIEKHDKQLDEKHKKSSDNVDRYLRCKYILMKDNSSAQNMKNQLNFDNDYNPLEYETYEIEYLKGYNAGDAHFLAVEAGRYILRIKSQLSQKDATYVINYCSNSNFNMKEIHPSMQQRTKILRDSMSSEIPRTKRFNLNKGDDNQTIAYGNDFQYIGYGFVGVRTKKTSTKTLVIQVDPKQLHKDGYKLKNQYKNEENHIAFVVKPGETMSVVFKKLKGDVSVTWPPKGVQIYEKTDASKIIKK